MFWLLLPFYYSPKYVAFQGPAFIYQTDLKWAGLCQFWIVSREVRG